MKPIDCGKEQMVRIIKRIVDAEWVLVDRLYITEKLLMLRFCHLRDVVAFVEGMARCWPDYAEQQARQGSFAAAAFPRHRRHNRAVSGDRECDIIQGYGALPAESATAKNLC